MKYLIFSLMFISTNLLGQIKLKDLQGYWISDNADSIYFKSDTIKFYQAQLYNQSDFNNKINNTLSCRRIGWTIKRKKLKIDNENLCIEPPRTIAFTKPWQIKLKKREEHN